MKKTITVAERSIPSEHTNQQLRTLQRGGLRLNLFTMKPAQKLKIAAILVPTVIFLSAYFTNGCASLQQPGSDQPGLDGKPKQILTPTGVFLVSTFRQATYQLGFDAVHEDSDAYQYMEQALELINALIDTENFDPFALREAIESIPVKEIHSGLGQIGVGAIVSLYEAYGQQAVDDGIENNLIALKLLEAGRDALTRILAEKPIAQRQRRGAIGQDGALPPLVATGNRDI